MNTKSDQWFAFLCMYLPHIMPACIIKESPNWRQKNLDLESKYEWICEIDKELRKMIDTAAEFGIKKSLSRIFKNVKCEA